MWIAPGTVDIYERYNVTVAEVDMGGKRYNEKIQDE